MATPHGTKDGSEVQAHTSHPRVGISTLERIWYGHHPLALLLAPVSLLFRVAVTARRWAYRQGFLSVARLPVPVVVVGNIAAGGTGKTPLVIALARWLGEQGRRPGVVSRGHGGGRIDAPMSVTVESDPKLVGDEPVVIAQGAAVPVVVHPDRVRAARRLLDEHGCDVVVSDDGLQHYRLGRDIEIAVIDGQRRHGNGRCLPAGPLREPLSRLAHVDLVVGNGAAHSGEFPMRLVVTAVDALSGDKPSRDLNDFTVGEVHAVCGIGNPQRFFSMLRASGIAFRPHAFPDHHQFRPDDFDFADDLPILMTEKDAVKCVRFPLVDAWVVRVSAQLPQALYGRLLSLLGECPNPGMNHGDGKN